MTQAQIASRSSSPSDNGRSAASGVASAAASDTRRPIGGDWGLVASLCATGLVVLSQLYGILPLFQPIAEDLSANPADAAWTQTAYGLAYSIALLAWGPAADRFGPRRTIVIGALANLAMSALVGLAPSIGVLIALRTVQGIVSASFAPSAFAIIAARVSPQHRGFSVALLTSSFLSAVAVGQLASRFLETLFSWRGFFLTSSIAFALIVLLLLRQVPHVAPLDKTATPLHVFGRLLRIPSAVLILIATPGMLVTMVGMFAALGRAGEVSGGFMGILELMPLPAVVVMLLLSGPINRISPVTRVVAMLILGGASMLGITLLGESWISIVLMFVVGFSVAVIGPALIAMFLPLALPDAGAGTALWSFMLFIGASIAPQVARLAGSQVGMGWMAVIIDIAMIVLLLTARAIMPRREHHGAGAH